MFLKHVFGFAEHQEKATYHLGHKITLRRSSDNHVLSHKAGTKAANLVSAVRVVFEDFRWYFLHYTPKLAEQNLLVERFVSRAATEFSYHKRSSYTKYVTTESNYTFEQVAQSGIDVPFLVKCYLMQVVQFNQQHQNIDTFFKATTVNGQCNIGSRKNPDVGINCNYAIDK